MAAPALELVPEYFKFIANTADKWSDKDAFMRAGYSDYTRLTEDSIWTLIGVASEGRLGRHLAAPANQLLTREILPHSNIRSGKADLLREVLLAEGLSDREDFHLLNAETTMYKARGDQRAFVQDEQDNIEEIPRHSETISAFRDRPEAESFLIILKKDRAEEIRAVADKGQFIFSGKESLEEEQLPAATTTNDGIQRIPPRRERAPDQPAPGSPARER